jgi:hypothetical protein
LLLVQLRRRKKGCLDVNGLGQTISPDAYGGFLSSKMGHDSQGVFGWMVQVHFNGLPYALILYTVSHIKRLDNLLSWHYFVAAIY